MESSNWYPADATTLVHLVIPRFPRDTPEQHAVRASEAEHIMAIEGWVRKDGELWFYSRMSEIDAYRSSSRCLQTLSQLPLGQSIHGYGKLSMTLMTPPDMVVSVMNYE